MAYRQEYYHDYYLRNKDRILERNKKYKEENREAIRQRRHLAYLANREKHIKEIQRRLQRKKKWVHVNYQKDMEKRNSLKSEWAKREYDKNRDKWEQSMIDYYTKRYQAYLKSLRQKRENKKLKKIQKRKEETNRL